MTRSGLPADRRGAGRPVGTRAGAARNTARSRGWVRRHLASLAVLAVAVLVGAAPSRAALVVPAHTQLVSVVPADGSTIDTPPIRIEITFNEDISPTFAQVSLTTGGSALALGTPGVSGRTVTAAIADPTPPGDYLIGFRVVSADGHPVSEQTSFTLLGPATPVTTATETGAPASPSPSSTTGVGEDATTARGSGDAAAGTDAGGGGRAPVLVAAGALLLLGVGLFGWDQRRRRSATGGG